MGSEIEGHSTSVEIESKEQVHPGIAILAEQKHEETRNDDYDDNLDGVILPDPYFKEYIQLTIPVEDGLKREAALERERELRFFCIFHKELAYDDKAKAIKEAKKAFLSSPSFFITDEVATQTRREIEDTDQKIKDNAFLMFLNAVMHGYVKLADHYLKEYPDFLTRSGNVQNKFNKTHQLENKNALEIACHEGDLQMTEILLTHYQNASSVEKQKAFEILDEYYPDPSDVESKEDGLFDFTEIVNVINENEAILKTYDVNLYIQKKRGRIEEDKIDDDTKKRLQILETASPAEKETFERINTAVNQFIRSFKKYEDAQDKNLAIQNLSKAWGIYRDNSQWNKGQDILFFSNIMGFVDTRLSFNDAFAMCQGIQHINEGRELTRKSLTIRDYTKKPVAEIPLFSPCLGVSFGVYSYYRGSRGWGETGRVGAALKTYVEQKPGGFMNLKKQWRVACEQQSLRR